jgi:adenosylcobinamide-phosphate synthase
MMPLSAWFILPLAAALDLAAGDPARLPHPVRLMGRLISRLEGPFRRLPLPEKGAGLLFAGALVTMAYGSTLALAALAFSCHPALGLAVEAGIVYTCLSGRCLQEEALQVRDLLLEHRLEEAREKTAMLVSRDVSALDERGLVRAVVETVSENFVDGVLSPLFYAALLGAPGAVAFKMASTLDSMVGYRNERYERFGKASARLDDILNWIPARVSIPVVAASAHVLLRSGKSALRTALRDGAKHKSPNAGRPEAAFSGSLRIKINGPGVYHGRIIEKPWIGEDFGPPGILDIEKAAALMLASMLASLPVFVLLQLAAGMISFTGG